MSLHYLWPKFEVKSTDNHAKDHLVDTVHKKMASSELIGRFYPMFGCLSVCGFYCLSKIPNCCNEHSEEELVDGFGNVCDLKKIYLNTQSKKGRIRIHSAKSYIYEANCWLTSIASNQSISVLLL